MAIKLWQIFGLAYLENSRGILERESWVTIYKTGTDVGYRGGSYNGRSSYTKPVRPIVRVNKSDVGL